MNYDSATLTVAALVAIVTFVGYMALDLFFGKKRQSEELSGRILGDEIYDEDGSGEELLSIEEKRSSGARTLSVLMKLLGIDVEKNVDKLAPRFRHAGINHPDASIYYIFFQRIVSIFLVFLSLLFLLTDAEGTQRIMHMLCGAILIILGLFGPSLYLRNAIDKRKKVLQRSFPDALDLLLVCVESGLALDAALGRVCRELDRAHPVITEELNRTRMELTLLNDRTRALMNLGERTDLVAFRSLAAALIQTEKFGTSLTDTLRVLSDDYRQTRLLIAENKANRIPVLITIPLILLLMPAFIMIIMGPAIVRVINQGGIFGRG
jgi:tight adherence protein C